jgi:hypothetical protein
MSETQSFKDFADNTIGGERAQWFTWQFLEQYVAFPHLPHVSKLSLPT